jgi:hypothetical protein
LLEVVLTRASTKREVDSYLDHLEKQLNREDKEELVRFAAYLLLRKSIGSKPG